MSNNKQVVNSLLRQNFASFIMRSFYTINPGVKFLPNWHIDLIAQYLEEIYKGEKRRLIINLPPRSLKSICVSVAWPAWLLGKNPAARIMVASYSQALSIKHSLDTKLLMESSWYQSIFPSTLISKKHNQKTKFLTTQNGFRFATSVNGTATGEGGDFLIIDDPHNPIYINSKKRRDNVLEWFDRTFSTRLNDKKTGSIILVMQRLHQEDLSGYLLERGGWDLLKIPAIADRDLVYQTKKFSIFFKEGSILHSDREATDNIKIAQRDLGHVNFAAQYQQEPISANNGLIKIDDLEFFDEINHGFDSIIQSWDTAIKAKTTADFSVCTTWGIKDNKYYLINLTRDKFEYPALKQEAIKLARKWLPNNILIEDKASGSSLIQDLKNSTDFKITPIKVSLDKITRFSQILEYFLERRVYIPTKKFHKDLIVNELLSFPAGKNDDIVDSISQFLNYIRSSKKLEVKIRNL